MHSNVVYLIMSTIFFVCITTFFSAFGPKTTVEHDFHLSNCNINYATEQEALQITLHIFIDDLELALKDIGYDSLYLCTRKETEMAEDAMLEYIGSKLKFSVDQVPTGYEYIGKEVSDDLAAVYVYLEMPAVSRNSEIDIAYDLLMEQFDDQRNMVVVKKDKKRLKDYFCTHEKYKLTVQL